MHFVIVPDPVVPRNIHGKPYTEVQPGSAEPKDLPAISLHAYLLRYVINETRVEVREGGQPKMIPKMGEGYAGSKAIRKLDRLFEKAQPGDIVQVEDADWERVRNIINEMSFSPPHFGAQLEPIADAWMRAPETKEEAEKQNRGAAEPA